MSEPSGLDIATAMRLLVELDEKSSTQEKQWALAFALKSYVELAFKMRDGEPRKGKKR